LVAPLLVPVIVKIDVVGRPFPGLVGVELPPQELIAPIRMIAQTIKNAGCRLLRDLPKGKAVIATAIAKNMVLNGNPWRWACEVVATVTVTGTLEESVGRFADTGLTLQVVPAGAPLQPNATVPEKPFSADSSRL